jgi:chemotaxis protein CheY-P-specific phosphatase CheC
LVAKGMEPADVNIDVSKVNILKIETVNKYIGDSGMYFSDPNRMILFADARLSK